MSANPLFQILKARASNIVTGAIAEYAERLPSDEKKAFFQKIVPQQEKLHVELAQAKITDKEEANKYVMKRLDEIYKLE